MVVVCQWQAKERRYNNGVIIWLHHPQQNFGMKERSMNVWSRVGQYRTHIIQNDLY